MKSDLSASGIQPPACPVCHVGGAAGFAVASDRLFSLAPGSFRLFRCRSCRCIFQHPMPESAAIRGFYPPEYWWSDRGKDGLSSFFSRMERVYREFVARDHVRFLTRCAGGAAAGRSLLDIGCGSGTFLHLARERGFFAHGMDVSIQAVTAARKQYDLPVRQGDIGSSVWDGRRFDFVSMFHVLEHLPDPRRALAYAAGLMNPGGRLILQVPNADSVQACLFGSHWYGLDVPRHLINFTPRSLSILLEDSGYRCRRIRRFSLRDNPAALASSAAMRLDPIGRRGRGKRRGTVFEGAIELLYFALVLAALPPALLESWCGRGATLWAEAQPRT